jgi:Holliday junction resolvase
MEMSQVAEEGGKVFYPLVEPNKSEKSQNEKKGKLAEKSFEKFLNRLEIPFYYIDQNKETFSKKFDIEDIKRPDYIVYTAKGVFHVDVKYRTKFQVGLREDVQKEERFYLSQKDIEKLFNFYYKLRSDTWIAFTNDEKSTDDFFFAPIQKIYDYYVFITDRINERRSRNDNPEEFDRIHSSGFCPIIIPETFLYNRLSFERCFYKEPDCDFSEADIGYHLDHVKETTKNDEKNIYPKGYCIKCNETILFNKDKPLCELHSKDTITRFDFYEYCHKCGSDIEPVGYDHPLCKSCFDKIRNNSRWGAHL